MSWDPSQPLPAAFAEVAQRVYRDDPFWLGEELGALARAFSNANPYFARNRGWLGVHEGRARLAGFFEPGKTIDDEPVAFFGYWEGDDELAVHQPLFAEFEAWARAQGARVVYGPINFTTHGNYRVRLNQFDQGAFIGEPWNPPYYPGLMRSLGYQEHYRYRTDVSRDRAAMLATYGPVVEKYRQRLAGQFTLQPLTGAWWLDNLDRLYAQADAIFGSNFAYSPIPAAAFRAACGEPIAKKLCPDSSVLALDPAGDIAGLILNFPDYSPLCCRGAAAPVPVEAVRQAAHAARLPQPRTILVKTAVVVPRYRGVGLYSALFAEAIVRALASGYDHAFACLAREDNLSVTSSALLGSSEDTRWYALYAKSL